MINLIIKDGLGNQMFQYAYARLLKEIYLKQGVQEQISILTEFINNRQDVDNDVRRMSLQHLVLNDDVMVAPEQNQPHLMKRFKRQTILSSGVVELVRWRLLRRFKSTDALAERRGKAGVYYPYGPYPYHPITLSEKDDKFVFGFFQNFLYVNALADILHRELLVKTPPSVENKRMLERISKVNAVCLHIRRGDYLKDRWKCLQVCDFHYYNKAIDEILKRTENPVFFVFSNTHEDLKWIEENYKFDQKLAKTGKPIEIHYVDLSNPDYEELRLMYSCRHFIISNSTFSWWAAWLSLNEDKVVCVPARWNLEYDNDINIYDPAWIKIPR